MSVYAFDGPGVEDDADGIDSVRPTPSFDTESPWDALEQAMRRPLPKEINAISPLHRPEIEVQLRTNIDLDELNKWRQGAKDEAAATGFDPLRMVCILLANASTDIVVKGKSTGQTLASEKVHGMFPEAFDEVDAVRHFFGKEDLWLTTRVLPALMSAWAGGEDGAQPLRPTAAGLSKS